MENERAAAAMALDEAKKSRRKQPRKKQAKAGP